MKKTGSEDRFSENTARSAKQKRGAFEEAQALFEEMSGEIRRRAEIEREDARRRSLPVRILFVLMLVSTLAAVAVGGYGIYNFPDAPLRQKGETFTGKRGQPRTREDFERFVVWQRSLIAVFGSAFFFGIAFGIADSREKRRRRLPK